MSCCCRPRLEENDFSFVNPALFTEVDPVTTQDKESFFCISESGLVIVQQPVTVDVGDATTEIDAGLVGLTDLSTDCLIEICRHLGLTSIFALSTTCRHIHAQLRSEDFWQALAAASFPNVMDTKPERESWLKYMFWWNLVWEYSLAFSLAL